MPKLAFFFSSFHRTRNRIVERLKRGPQATPTEGCYGWEKFEKMVWFCDLLILTKDSVFIAVKRDAIFCTRYVGAAVSPSTVKNVAPSPFKEEIGRFMQRKHNGKWSNENREARQEVLIGFAARQLRTPLAPVRYIEMSGPLWAHKNIYDETEIDHIKITDPWGSNVASSRQIEPARII